MSEIPHISLEQWRALIAVVEAGGYAQAAERLYKSQSAVTYAVQKIESLLDLKAFEIQGRKAMLTPTGQMLYRRALALVNEANELERSAKNLSAGWEAEIGIASEILFPSWLLLDCLDIFGKESPQTRIELIESVMSGTAEALLGGHAALAITPHIPPGFFGELLMRTPVIAVAHPDHPLHTLGKKLTLRDLRNYRHITIRDSGTQRDRRAVIVEVEQRWTVSDMATSIEALCQGYGFSWLPRERISRELADGRLKPLALREGQERWIDIYLIVADPDFAGPGVRRLAEIIRERTAASCTKHKNQ
ncbi:MAG TPA: LysR family transcriptional regulator [Rhodocyclaceae bacterium]|nr:LysR family transcriptional regulator [Rhodocyclaceae bacterium]